MTNTVEKITKQDETRSTEIARIVAQLPQNEQDKIYYMIKGVELAGASKGNSEPRAAV